jgi:hypothetical protein
VTPSVGRIVHFHHPDFGGPLAAIITKVEKKQEQTPVTEWRVWISIFFPALVSPWREVSFSEGPEGWSWPPRVS